MSNIIPLHTHTPRPETAKAIQLPVYDAPRQPAPSTVLVELMNKQVVVEGFALALAQLAGTADRLKRHAPALAARFADVKTELEAIARYTEWEAASLVRDRRQMEDAQGIKPQYSPRFHRALQGVSESFHSPETVA